jgi:hypothetical protein
MELLEKIILCPRYLLEYLRNVLEQIIFYLQIYFSGVGFSLLIDRGFGTKKAGQNCT